MEKHCLARRALLLSHSTCFPAFCSGWGLVKREWSASALRNSSPPASVDCCFRYDRASPQWITRARARGRALTSVVAYS
jgi:hypothetical protein